MTIQALRIMDFRNLESVDIAPCVRGLNIISGNNGSGKTSLLEAIHFLSHGKSFRSSTISPLIRQASQKFIIHSQLVTASSRQLSIGVERELSGSGRFRVEDRDTTSVAEIAAFLPIRVINSHSHQIFESGPTHRRKYLDWGLFYQSDSFFNSWRYFERALKQRNALLRDRRGSHELAAWTAEVVKYGMELDAERRAYVALLENSLAEIARLLLPVKTLELSYQCGWDDALHYEAALASSSHEEFRFGYTQYGPHRADLDITVDGLLAKQILSRGQQKLLICAMIIAQGRMLAKYVNKGLIYLIDDLPSELDIESRRKLIALLANQQTQIFITAIEQESICSLMSADTDVPLKVFHVEHGQVAEVTMRTSETIPGV